MHYCKKFTGLMILIMYALLKKKKKKTDMSFGSPSQKFQLAGMKFEGHQGMGGPSPGGNEMVMYS